MQYRFFVTSLLICALAACGGAPGTERLLPGPGGKAERLPDQLPLSTIDGMDIEILCSAKVPCPVFSIKICNHTEFQTLPVELHLFYSVADTPESFAAELLSETLPRADSIIKLDPQLPKDELGELLEDNELPCQYVSVTISGRMQSKLNTREGMHDAWAMLVLPPDYILQDPWRLSYNGGQPGETFVGAPCEEPTQQH